MGDYRQDLKTKFFKKVKRGANGCVLWTGACNQEGVPVMRVEDRLRRATHVSWFLKHGEWPKRLQHTCGDPKCVAIKHLELTTHNKTSQVRGADVHSAKLSESDVREIYRLCKETDQTYVEIGRRFGIAPANVRLIKNGALWAHLWPGPIKKRTRGERIRELAKQYDMPENTVRWRLKQGRDLELQPWEKR
jgi:transposase-like protein